MRKLQPVLKQEKTLNPELKTWLYASGSLTQQLTELCGGRFIVKPFKEQFQRLTFADSQWMNMPHT
uniref:chorismate lyase n=1 Tax=Acinetobacter baumannii TaxID=470 RepID=UPI000A7DCBE3